MLQDKDPLPPGEVGFPSISKGISCAVTTDWTEGPSWHMIKLLLGNQGKGSTLLSCLCESTVDGVEIGESSGGWFTVSVLLK